MANVTFAGAGSSVGVSSLAPKSSMRRTRKWQNTFPKSRENNFNARSFTLIKKVRFSSRRQRFIDRYAVVARKSGCGGGVVFSVLLIVRVAPAISAGLLFVFYLSLVVVGQNFLSFQWDILLLETGFLAIFFAPWQLWPKDKPKSAMPAAAVPSVAL